MITKTVAVTQWIKVTIDEAKFDEQFMQEFRESMMPYYDIDDHIKHLAQLHACGIADDDDFIEGYGMARDMGIKFEWMNQQEEIAE